MSDVPSDQLVQTDPVKIRQAHAHLHRRHDHSPFPPINILMVYFESLRKFVRTHSPLLSVLLQRFRYIHVNIMT